MTYVVAAIAIATMFWLGVRLGRAIERKRLNAALSEVPRIRQIAQDELRRAKARERGEP